MTRPFEGVKILDFTQVLAGPYASYQLALLGADVIKIERRGGEDMRRTPLSREWAERNLAPAFQAVNGNKKSLTLDLSRPEALAIVRRVVEPARRVGEVLEDDVHQGDRSPEPALFERRLVQRKQAVGEVRIVLEGPVG